MTSWGTILICLAILCISASIILEVVVIEFSHPWDYVAHCITNIAGVLFFFGILQKVSVFGFTQMYAIVFSVIIMVTASLTKEVMDDVMSVSDLAGDFFGIVCALWCISFFSDIEQLSSL